MRLDVITARNGGPFQWGRDLVDIVNAEYGGRIRASHIHSPLPLALSYLDNPDIAHTTVPVPFVQWKKPLVATIQGDYTIEQNLGRRLYPGLVSRADVVTVPSRLVQCKLGLDKAVVIPNAVFPEQFEVAPHTPKDTVNLVTVSNFYFLDKAEGVLDIVNVLSKVRSCQFKYTVIGGGRYLDMIRKQVNEVVANVCFTGFLPNPKPILAHSDIFLYHSNHDTFPIAILEAMASGLPVITNDIGAVSEIIDNGKDGYVAKDDDDYLARLSGLLSNQELRQRIGRNARDKVNDNFDWHKVSKQFVAIYEKLAGGEC